MKKYICLLALISACAFTLSLEAVAEFHFDNQTDEEVILSARFKSKQGSPSRTIRLQPHQSVKEVVDGCLQEVHTQPHAELIFKNIPEKTIWKPNTRYSCKAVVTSIYKTAEGAFDLTFVYQ